MHLFVKTGRRRSANLYALRLHRMKRRVSEPGFQNIERSIDCGSVKITLWILMKLGWQSPAQKPQENRVKDIFCVLPIGEHFPSGSRHQRSMRPIDLLEFPKSLGRHWLRHSLCRHWLLGY
jgi:hypothetical protein